MTQRHASNAGPGQARLDRAGVCVGLICAGHCMLAAWAPALLAFVDQPTDAGWSIEWLVVVVSFALAGLAGAVGFRRHGRRWVPALFMVSVGLLLASRCLEERDELSWGAAFVALLGGLGVAAGHVANQRCCRGREQCAAAVLSAEAGGS